MRDAAELLVIKIATTAAESLWFGYMVEHHNSEIEQVVLENALAWVISAQNALQSNAGFTSNQLVIGSNTKLPSVLTARAAALWKVTPSQLIADHLNTLHAARKLLIQCESSQKIKIVLNHHT